MTVWIYVDTSKQVGDVDHLKVFASEDAAMGLEGLVSKRSDRPYRGGRSPHWIKVKNRQHHAFDRVRKSFS